MFIYQAAIMLAVVLIVFGLVFILKVKNPTILAISILVLVIGGGLSLSLIQEYFGNHYYPQKIDISLYNCFNLTEKQKSSLPLIFKDYKNITSAQDQFKFTLQKTYKINEGNANSTVTVDFMLFNNKQEADEYFSIKQLFYETENKNYIQEDPKLSKKPKSDSFRYITSYIRSDYTQYHDIIYVPSKINYQSDSIIQNNSLIVVINENSNKPVINKDKVLKSIADQIAAFK